MHEEVIKALGQVLRQNNADIEQKLERVRVEAKAAVQGVMNWDLTGSLVKQYRAQRAYKAGDIVVHRNGVWQAVEDTDAAPEGADSGWVCVTNGLHDLRIETRGERGRVAIVEMSTGQTHEVSEWTDPTPIHRGLWDPEAQYEAGDEVAKDGSLWRCSVEASTGDEPGKSGAWLLAAQRGKTGRPGPQGDRGEKGDVGQAGRDADPLTTAKMLLRAVNSELEARIDG